MQRSYIVAFVLLSIFLSLFLAQKINLTTADLGRHIKNGEMFLNAGEFGVSRNDILHTNFFSYTEPDSPFVNHHWASGILFYLAYLATGWHGLSLLYILFFVLTFGLAFFLARQKIPLFILIPLALFLIPLIAEREEIRPEVLSYVFIMAFIYLLTLFAENRVNKKTLYILPFVSLIWANTHIYFVFGIFIIGVFLLEELLRKNFSKAKQLLLVLVFSSLAVCITPYGLDGALYPFSIFDNYGYGVAENKSISFLENINFVNPNFLWWKITTIFTLLSSLVLLKIRPRRFPIALGLIALTFGVLSFTSIRNLSIFGLVTLPFLAFVLGEIYEHYKERFDRESVIVGSVLISTLLILAPLFVFSTHMPWNGSWGTGLLPGINASAEFALAQDIKGPIFSNYDIGGYLIFHMYPREKVFVDNRPEAYTPDFFQKTYMPMQEEREVWERISTQYAFNTIWFYRHDLTPWAQEFLLRMVGDPLWAPVYVDDYTIIFLKRNEKNSSLINKFELPRSLFSRG